LSARSGRPPCSPACASGELRALDWSQVDLQRNLITVERSWDRHAGFIAPKSRSGRRRVPVTPTLRRELLTHRLRQGNGGQGLVFANRRGTGPFNPGTVALHSKPASRNAGLNPIGLHECRHSYAAYMIAAGINPKALSTYMGHSSITVTLDRYGHLLPGNEHEAAALLDSWLKHHQQQATVTDPPRSEPNPAGPPGEYVHKPGWFAVRLRPDGTRP
jgi:integrase